MIVKLLTPRVREWLRNSGRARVLHLFDEACTLVNERDEVIALVSPRVGPGPFSVIVAGDFTAGLGAQSPVAIDGARLTVGPLAVDTGTAAVWQPRPAWERLRDADASRWPPAGPLPPPIEGALARALDGIASGQTTAFLAGVEGLLGRGGGLTPTGDDVVMGIAYGLWARGEPAKGPRRRDWLALVAEAVAGRTTTLSANFIRAAVAGEATEPWHDLALGRPHAIERILATGHTSGADAWVGFVLTWGLGR